MGVVVLREEIDNPWQDYAWRPVEVVPGAPETEDWKEMRRGEGWIQYHAATVPLELFRKETEAYKTNLEGGRPVVYVILYDEEEEDSDFPAVHLVTASPFEAQDYLDSGEQIVEAVPMPDPVAAWMEDFVRDHHVEETFKKRQRDEVNIEEHKFGNESLAELRKRQKERQKIDE